MSFGVLIKPTKPSQVFPSQEWVYDEENISLLELVLKFVYCETLPKKTDNGETIPEKFKNFTLQEEAQMKFSIDYWYKAVMKRKEQKIILFKVSEAEVMKNPDEIHLQLMKYASLIRKKEGKDPTLMRRLMLFKEGKVDYRKVYKLPGAHVPEDFHRARLSIDFWNSENPDLA